MKKSIKFISMAATAMVLVSCGPKVPKQLYLNTFSPEESGLNLVKITDEAAGSVIAGSTNKMTELENKNKTFTNSLRGWCRAAAVTWYAPTNLAISPDGTKLAYLTRNNGQDNVVIRSAGSMGVSTQRTFRNVVGGFCWGKDNKIYFADANRPNYYISSVSADQGTVMSQHTNGNVDDSYPALSDDGTMLFFTRYNSTYGPSIWSLNLKDGTLSSCARGYNACPVPGNNNAFYCVRNASVGKSEIWLVDFVKGQESLLLSDVNRSFTSPTLSPDGKWLLVVGNSASNISHQQNLDIFAVRTDGSQLTQLTYHPMTDMCPVWSRDGKYIYFISSRANENSSYNIWRMSFNL